MLGGGEVGKAAQAFRLRSAGLKVFVAALTQQYRGLFDLNYPMAVLLKGLGGAPTHAGRLGAQLGLVLYLFDYFFGILFHIVCGTMRR